jgi:hypothetical protein
MGQVTALATTPINKESFHAAGVRDIGHTELLGRLTGANDPLTLFQVFDLKVFFLSRHVSLANAIRLITRGRVLDYLQRCTAALESGYRQTSTGGGRTQPSLRRTRPVGQRGKSGIGTGHQRGADLGSGCRRSYRR